MTSARRQRLVQKLVPFRAVTRSFIPIHTPHKSASPLAAPGVLGARPGHDLRAAAPPPSPEGAPLRRPSRPRCAPSKRDAEEKGDNYRHSPCFIPFPVFNRAFFALPLVFPCRYFCLQWPGIGHESRGLVHLPRPLSAFSFFADVTRERAPSQRLLYFTSGTGDVSRGRVTKWIRRRSGARWPARALGELAFDSKHANGRVSASPRSDGILVREVFLFASIETALLTAQLSSVGSPCANAAGGQIPLPTRPAGQTPPNSCLPGSFLLVTVSSLAHKGLLFGVFPRAMDGQPTQPVAFGRSTAEPVPGRWSQFRLVGTGGLRQRDGVPACPWAAPTSHRDPAGCCWGDPFPFLPCPAEPPLSPAANPLGC